ncbi:MAG: aspartate--tRNA ligase [Bacteriovoracaceae bacterium]|nr:aspartate--tRNA ligase [Bacteriovoracaceae bacterium]
MDKVSGLMYSHNCGELNKEHIGATEVVLCGWVNKYRNLGGLHFIDIRDKHGVTQAGFEKFPHDTKILKECSLESVIRIKGEVVARPDSAINSDMKTGEVELQVLELSILSQADKDNIPFLPFGSVGATEDLRLKYRYLDLRTTKLQDILAIRAGALNKVRSVLIEEDFLEVETPILYKSTPEGARDYIVPSRVHRGKVYALPQSPQTLKQLLMIGATSKYYQIARCFRDEDLRADRQPEFTQIDLEVSFATAEYIQNICRKVISKVFSLEDDFDMPMMDYKTAMELYGSDKPDVRFGLKQMIVTSAFKDSSFTTFSSVEKAQGLIKAMFIPATLGTFSRKLIDKFAEVVRPFGGGGVGWFKIANGQRSGGISKFITDEIAASLETKLEQIGESSGDGLWTFFADTNPEVAHASADGLRRHIGSELKLHKEGYHFLWVYDFPLFEWSEEQKRALAKHHPFTHPKMDQLQEFMEGDLSVQHSCLAEAYDVVCNGFEIGGGSIRIHNQDVQKKMFEALGMGEEEIKSQFGFLVDAMSFGAPPHGGVAFGFDRIVMLLAKTENIKDVIAFPKTTSAADLMSQAPSIPSDAQLDELALKWQKD